MATFDQWEPTDHSSIQPGGYYCLVMRFASPLPVESYGGLTVNPVLAWGSMIFWGLNSFEEMQTVGRRIIIPAGFISADRLWAYIWLQYDGKAYRVADIEAQAVRWWNEAPKERAAAYRGTAMLHARVYENAAPNWLEEYGPEGMFKTGGTGGPEPDKSGTSGDLQLDVDPRIKAYLEDETDDFQLDFTFGGGDEAKGGLGGDDEEEKDSAIPFPKVGEGTFTGPGLGLASVSVVWWWLLVLVVLGGLVASNPNAGGRAA